MLIVGITGGIGSGKSVVGKIVETLGYPVYNADIRAKEILREDDAVRKKIIDLLGEESYHGSEPNREFIAKKVFNNPEQLSRLNQIVHPAVREDFGRWVQRQSSALVFKEAAILIESGIYKDVDRVVLVTAPKDLRIRRVMGRDNVREEDVLARMKNQMTDTEKLPFTHFQINNDGEEPLIPQVVDIIEKLRS